MTLAERNSSLNGLDPQNANFVRSILADMAFIRAFEDKAWSFSKVNPPLVAGSMHFCAGQEAVALGGVAGLRVDDQIIATYRGHGWALAAGIDPSQVMAEICQRSSGLNGGRGGSAYMMAPGTRFIGENSIVGAGTTIACGVAMANLAAGNKRVVLVTIGDGAMNQGAVHEALSFAAARKLPVIFVVENNGWSEMTKTEEMFLVERLSKRASGYGIPSATVDGTNPVSVRDTVSIAAARARAGEGPCLLEFTVPRLWGHYNRDIEHYRGKADHENAKTRDPITLLKESMIEAGFLSQTGADELIAEQVARANRIGDEALAQPEPSTSDATLHVSAKPEGREPEVVETVTMTYIDAVNRALRDELESDDRTIFYGEDVGKAGGIFGAGRYLQRDFGENRVFDTPIAENAILGSAVGAAISGLKPIVEIMWADFLFVAIDQLVNQASNIRYITGGKMAVPMVVRTQQGATPGSCAQHSQCIEALLAHIPGLKVALAASATDAYELLRSAAADPDPCVVIESRALYQSKDEVNLTKGAGPVGTARLRKSGKDCAILTWGSMVPRALEAAEKLRSEGIDASVLDLRWLSPLDEAAIKKVVLDAGGKAVIVHEAVRTGGFAGELAIRLTEMMPNEKLTVSRLTTPDVRMPAAPALQSALIPGADSIAALVKGLVQKLRG